MGLLGSIILRDGEVAAGFSLVTVRSPVLDQRGSRHSCTAGVYPARCGHAGPTGPLPASPAPALTFY